MTVSLRDYLAAHASEADVERWREWESQVTTVKGLCEWAEDEAIVVVGGSYRRSAEEARYAFADAMLQAKKGPEGEGQVKLLEELSLQQIEIIAELRARLDRMEGVQQTVASEETPGQWHLPSRDVLNAMYGREVWLGGFSTGHYWSSSEDGGRHAWYQVFYDGYRYSTSKRIHKRVRAVRALPDDTTETERLFRHDGVTYQGYPIDAPKSLEWEDAIRWCEQLNREDE